MTNNEAYSAFLRVAQHWQHAPPGAEPATIAALRTQSGLHLPPLYLAVLGWSDGGEGDLPCSPYWFQFWPAAQVMELNAGYELPRWVPGFFGFGSSGGGALLAFDTRQAPPWPVCALPCMSLDASEAGGIAADFTRFLALTGQPWGGSER